MDYITNTFLCNKKTTVFLQFGLYFPVTFIDTTFPAGEYCWFFMAKILLSL